MWVCRAGQKAIYLDYFLENSRIYLVWQGFRSNLRNYESRYDYRELVMKEKNTDNHTSVSNWSGQLFSFCHEMCVGNYVIIPHERSRKYCLAKITGIYEYDENDERGLFHSHQIEIINDSIPKELFDQTIQYSLGAFRTIFRAKNEDEILRRIFEIKK